MYIRAPKKIHSGEPQLCKSSTNSVSTPTSEGDHLCYYHIEDAAWENLLDLFDDMAHSVLNAFSGNADIAKGITRFIKWLELRNESTRHITHEESAGLYTCLRGLQSYVAEHSEYLAREMGFLMELIEASDNGLHYVFDMSEVGEGQTMLTTTEMKFYAPNATQLH